MNNVIYNTLKEYNESIKPNTLKKYTSNILNLKKYLNYDKNDLNFIKKKDEILKVLNKKGYSIQTKNSYIVACLQVSKAFKFENSLINFYIQQIKKYNNQIKSKYATQEKSEKQKKNWVTWPRLIKFYKKYRRKVRDMRLTKKTKLSYQDFLKVQNMVLLSCYLSNYKENPPRRNIYGSLLIRYESKKYKENILDDDKNYLFIQSARVKYFIFNQYKTVKNYGKLKIKINKELNNDINLYLRFNKTKYFMPAKTKNKNMSSEDITNRLKKLFYAEFKKNISSQMIRQILMSYVHKDTPKVTFLKTLSLRMGHSLLTGLSKYTKKPKTDEELMKGIALGPK